MEKQYLAHRSLDALTGANLSRQTPSLARSRESLKDLGMDRRTLKWQKSRSQKRF